MKTIKQIADEIGVSKTAIRKKMTAEVKTKFAETVSGIVFISEQGEYLIKSAFNKIQPETKFAGFAETVSGEVSGQVSTLISMLQKELEVRNKELETKNFQLEIKDRQIEELTITIRIQAESINAANKNELAETIIDGNKKLIEESKIKNRGGIFKIFSRKK